jgi:hypothetical protein
MRSTATGTISSGVLIEYYRSGGFLGLDDHLVIDADLKASLTRRDKYYEFEIDRKTFEHILQQLDKAEFSKLKGEYLPASTCCDLIEYTITYNGYTVRAMDTAVPESLQPILDSLNQIIDTETKP